MAGMDIDTAQRDMADANVGGAPGVLVSGLAWLAAGVAWSRSGVPTAFAVLFVGGMLIVPLAMLIGRLVFHAPRAAPGNPLDRLGLESTFVLFGGLLIAFALLRISPNYVFPILTVVIGTRYFVFRTIYGQPLYWLLAGLVVAAGSASLLGWVTWPGNLALMVGAIELVLAVVLFGRHRSARNTV